MRKEQPYTNKIGETKEQQSNFKIVDVEVCGTKQGNLVSNGSIVDIN